MKVFSYFFTFLILSISLNIQASVCAEALFDHISGRDLHRVEQIRQNQGREEVLAYIFGIEYLNTRLAKSDLDMLAEILIMNQFRRIPAKDLITDVIEHLNQYRAEYSTDINIRTNDNMLSKIAGYSEAQLKPNRQLDKQLIPVRNEPSKNPSHQEYVINQGYDRAIPLHPSEPAIRKMQITPRAKDKMNELKDLLAEKNIPILYEEGGRIIAALHPANFLFLNPRADLIARIENTTN